jgi:hypothetical protein
MRSVSYRALANPLDIISIFIALKAKTLSPKDLILDHAQLIAHSYPIHSYHQADSVLPEGWIETPIDKSKIIENPTRIISLDCEMV